MRTRCVAASAALLGLVVSIAGNVAHTWLLSPAPSVGAVASSVIWPVLLAVALELLRAPWPGTRALQWIRWGGTGTVGLVSGLVSYRHLSGLLAHYGEDPVTCALGPVAVDGLVVMAVTLYLVTPESPAAVTADGDATPAVVSPVVAVAPDPVPVAPALVEPDPEPDTQPKLESAAEVLPVTLPDTTRVAALDPSPSAVVTAPVTAVSDRAAERAVRVEHARRLLATDPDAKAPALVALLAEHGIAVDTRTAQRDMRAAKEAS